MGDASRVGEVRRHVAHIAAECQWSDTDGGRLGIVATELATNLVRHAHQGELWIAFRPAFGDIEILAVDRGPGMADIPNSMIDGTSTGTGSPGTGLGAVSRLADDFEITSSPAGTVCLARLRPAQTPKPALADVLGAVCLALPPDTVSGDDWAVVHRDGEVAMVVADGLGHGPLAAEASSAAISAFLEDPFEPLVQLVQKTHTALQTTRGAAVLALQIEASDIRYCGMGNVMGRVFTGLSDRSLVGQHGTAGVQINRPVVAQHERPTHGVVALHTDGITSRWKADTFAGLLGKDPALLAASLLWHNTRARDDATVVVLKELQ